ncbi:ABC transporter ATP-binding protein [Thalassotalea ponticola]|uniref:ABC transporter ATP-binding protein n=1 Tax=Thalassotalea ponticola TaxID=1523392 RepID=UPI0025B514E0|nr:ABC transporter ATP-binding protein [Thalassotalea ponticola]MDN3651633.1 ABC transporter ATP-binding protein [Thalassotalea ponticola]
MSVAIDIHELQFRWSESADHLLAIDRLTIAQGEKVFLYGPSGSGKTTLLSLLCGINSVQSGQLTLLNTDLSLLTASQRDQFRADHLGVIFQMFNLIPYLTSIENVLLAVQFSASRKQNAIAKSGSLLNEAKRLLKHLDMADDTLLNKPVNQLSIGQQQRVAVARALMGSPKIIIADEPTSSLDAQRCEGFLQLLANECQALGATLIFVSHDLRLQHGFDRVFSLVSSTEHAGLTRVRLELKGQPMTADDNALSPLSPGNDR